MASFGHVGLGMRSFHRFSPVLTKNIVVSAFVLLTISVKVCSSGADDISSHDEEPAYFDQFYAQGVRAYTDQLWYKCAHNLEKAVEDYKKFKKTLTDCRMRCKQKEQEAEELSDLPTDLGDLSVFQSFLKRAHCFRRCKSDAYQQRPGLRLTKILETTFEERKPYQYLQYCWYKLDRLKLAASACYTFYLRNPGNRDVMRNIAYYRDKAKVPDADFIDLDLVPYKEHHIRALIAYRDDDWPKVTEHLEKGVKEFLIEEERCRTDCEDSIDDMETSSASHFFGAVADHFIKMLECQLGCERNLSVIYTEPEEKFFANQFHYLQYAYYKTEQIDKAVEATASYLLFDSEDEVMNENKNIFMKKYQYTEDQFVPTKEAKKYAEQKKKLKALYNFLQERFMKEVDDLIFVTTADAESVQLSEEAPEKPTTNYRTWMEQYERLGLHIIAQADDLHRPFRFAADGLLKQEQCDEILALMEDIPVDRKGAQIFTLGHGRETVPTKDENYEASLRLFLRATEVMRHYTQRYYNMSGTLFFKDTIMVCWQQVPNPVVEKDCVPQEFGTCEPETNLKLSVPAEDEFITVTYLSSVEDGDFYFLGENVSIDTSLGVRHGRTVGFRSGDRHGLHIPVESRRCALVNSYTTYRSDDERDYTETVEVLQRLEEIRMERGLRGRNEVMQKLKESGVRITKNGTALHGGERFVADGLASDAECASLKNMVMDLGRAGDGYKDKETPNHENEMFAGMSLDQVSQSGALVGDGYDRLEAKPSFISPHTEHELFQGLTIYRASKLMHSGMVNTFAMKSFLDLSEKSRLLVEKYFNLTRPLYFDFTHLVCRTPIDENKERKDLSHPVHADNCLLQADGSCRKEYPAYVQRDYSALLYLNEDFRGGEFFFAYSNKSEQVSLKPKCGRLVGFNAKEYHGVRAVRGGTRCALAMWYTLNPNFKELAHVHARKVLHAIQASREVEGGQKEIHTPPVDTSTDNVAGRQEEYASTDNASLKEGRQEENQTPSKDASTDNAADKQDERQTPVMDTSTDTATSSAGADAATSKKSDRKKNDDEDDPEDDVKANREKNDDEDDHEDNVKAHAVESKKGFKEDSGDDDVGVGVKDKVEL